MTFKINKDNCKQVYNYYRNQGLNCIVIDNIFHQFLYIFVVGFSFFLFTCINYRILFKTHDIHASLTYGFFGIHPIVVICLIILGLLWIWYFLSFILQIPDLKKIKKFYNSSLGIPDSRLATMAWSEVLEKNIEFNQMNKQITQKDNFMIELFKEKNWSELHINSRFVSKLFNWVLYSSFEMVFFNNPAKFEGMSIKTKKLQKCYFYMGIVITILSPFILISLIMYYFFKYTIEFKKSPASAGIRDWNLYARWKLRKINELPHDFETRLIKSNKPMYNFLDTNYVSVTSIIAKFVTFVTGSFLAVLTVLTLYDDHILVMLIDNGGRSVLWYITFFGFILTISSSFIPDTQRFYDSKKTLKKVVEHTEYKPYRPIEDILAEYDYLFSHKLTQLLEEIVSIFAMPYILFKVLPEKSEIIVLLFNETMEFNGKLQDYYIKEHDLEMGSNSTDSIKSNSSHGSNNSEISNDLTRNTNVTNHTSSSGEYPSEINNGFEKSSGHYFEFSGYKKPDFGSLFSSLINTNPSEQEENSENDDILSKNIDEITFN